MPRRATKTAAEKAEMNRQKQTQHQKQQQEKDAAARLAAAEAEAEMCREEGVNTAPALADGPAAVKDPDTTLNVIELNPDTLAERLQETTIDETDRGTVSLWPSPVPF